MEKATQQKTKKILSIVANVFVWLFVAFSLVTTLLVFSAQSDADGVPALFGKSMITIESDSMSPTFKRGDLILIEKLSGKEDTLARVKEIEVGEIITFWAPIDINGDGQLNDINTHRVEEKTDSGFKTKGDNNAMADTYTVSYTDVIGVAKENSGIPGVGAVIGFLQTSMGFLICIVLPLVIFFLYELIRFVKIVFEEKAKKTAGTVSAETEEEIKRRAIEEYLKAQEEAKKAESEKTEAAEVTEADTTNSDEE